MSYEEEEAILKPFYEKSEKGQIVESSEIKTAYQEKEIYNISRNSICIFLMKRK
ncbi:MAG: hypothetical protein IJ192_11220 [Clostridia bacterium]|nr:hypothetical protein [Clostridia bacterium]